MGRNLILGISDNYNYFHLSRFFESLYKTSFDGHVCLFVGPNTGANTVRQLQKLGVETILYKKDFPYISQPHPANFPALPDPIHIYNFRHFLYYDYILKHEQDFDNVLLTDVRDVVFQKDPFDFPIASQLYVAMESRDKRIGSCQYNSKWVLNGYGQEKLDELAEQIVSCAGTTLGPMAQIKRYLHTLLSAILELKDAYGCADQAVHNDLLHSGRIAPVRQLYNDDTPILTVGAEFEFKLDPQGYLLDGKGHRANTVHQYDRHPTLLAAVDKYIFTNPLRKSYLKLRYKLMP
ncbi:hypothetical protein Q5H93_05430 [Hymenobacter sp. ASUV-10]|uniref:Uncharacterized protein n=1 Tax=Hymenobacter aranciens TaxID=3063996 RepID=A0ABT9BBT1_9BACT|nr:hypothetical protein [Hymenobacter sp. ASUV-10]MDO7874166.1 hypothetical protein [Hymenobacter sp. ASUV-10]